MTMYLDDCLTSEELADTRAEVRRTHNPDNNPHGIPWKGSANPRLIVAGDMIALYAGNEFPVHVVTVESYEHDDISRVVTFETTGGEFVAPYGRDVWIAAYAPLLGD